MSALPFLHPLRFLTAVPLFFGLFMVSALGAKAPLSREALQSKASHIVMGTIVKVESKVRASPVETAFGLHRDRIYTFHLKVLRLSKRDGLKVEDTVKVRAWQPAVRIPPMPGLQGHVPLPKKGDQVRAYLQRRADGVLEPLLPNGFVVEKAAE